MPKTPVLILLTRHRRRDGDVFAETGYATPAAGAIPANAPISVSNWSNMVLGSGLAPAAFAAGPSSSLVPARDRSGWCERIPRCRIVVVPGSAADRSGFATNLIVRSWARVKLGYPGVVARSGTAA